MLSRAHTLAFPTFLTLLAVVPLSAQQNLWAYSDTVFAAWSSTHTPGCAVGVARDGQTLLTAGYGMADLEGGRPITPETIFESGSVAKQFTATAVMLLALDGKLRLDDPVRQYLPEMPQYDRPITIRHLLTHTSGIREWSSLVEWAGWPRGKRAHTQADLLDVAYRQKALNYPVGDYYSYTNSGYAVAMSLVERVSGKSFQQFTQERIFRLLGMTHTQWRDDYTRLVPGRAQAYRFEDGQWHLDMPFESVVGPGGLLTTVGDWLTWNEALTKNRLVPGLSDSLTRQMRLTNGRHIQYALGLFVEDYRGVPQVGHSGGTAGYRTYLARFPDRRVSIAVLCNAANATPWTYVRQLADRVIADFPRSVALDTTRADTARLSSVYGVYQSSRTHEPLELNAEMVTRSRALRDAWYWQPSGAHWHVEMQRNGGQAPRRLIVAQADGDTVEYVFRGAPWKPTARQLHDFEGTYRSDEVAATYRLTVVNDTLTMSMRSGVNIKLQPTHTDGFISRGTAVWFTRDQAGRVTLMHFSEPRMWDLQVPQIGNPKPEP